VEGGRYSSYRDEVRENCDPWWEWGVCEWWEWEWEGWARRCTPEWLEESVARSGTGGVAGSPAPLAALVSALRAFAFCFLSSLTALLLLCRPPCDQSRLTVERRKLPMEESSPPSAGPSVSSRSHRLDGRTLDPIASFLAVRRMREARDRSKPAQTRPLSR
jgi:hypothetical protein